MTEIIGRLPSLEFCQRVLLDPWVERAWLYSQLGMSQTQIGLKLGIRQTNISKMLKERREAVMYVDYVDAREAKRIGWEPWHTIRFRSRYRTLDNH